MLEYREPVFFTKDGEDDFAVMNKETCKEITKTREIYNLLVDGINDIKNGNVLSEEEMDKSIDIM
jgi:hypothetical protein